MRSYTKHGAHSMVGGTVVVERDSTHSRTLDCQGSTLALPCAQVTLCLCASVSYLKLRRVTDLTGCLLGLHGLVCVNTQDRAWRVGHSARVFAVSVETEVLGEGHR